MLYMVAVQMFEIGVTLLSVASQNFVFDKFLI
jgi:hypothetical protein